MGEASSQTIATLLQEGLDHYAEGREEEARACWSEVLFLAPDNVEARDYLQTLDDAEPKAEDAGGGHGASGRDASGPAAGSESLVADALKLMRAGDLEPALELLELASRHGGDRLEVQGYLDLVRSRLLSRYRERVGGMQAVPVVQLAAPDLRKFNLPAPAGFLLSLVDGRTSVEELVSLSGLDPFETLRTLSGLLEAGIVRSGSPTRGGAGRP